MPTQEPTAIIVSLVVAAAENGVIGRNGTLPWRMPSDLRAFRRLTMGKPVVMGRKTYQSIGKPLDGRDSIVVTRDPRFEAAGVTVARSVTAAFAAATIAAQQRGVDEIMVIGGAEIYAAFLPLADRIYLTRIHASPEGDAVLPPLDDARWREVSRTPIPRGERDEHEATLIVLEVAPASTSGDH